MSEKQTFSSEYTPSSTSFSPESTSAEQTQLDSFDDFNRSVEAALALANEPRQTLSAEPESYPLFPPESVESTPRTAPAPLPEDDGMSLGKKIAVGVTGVAATAAFAAGAYATQGGSNQPEQGNADTTVTQLVIGDEANIRHDPYVGKAKNDDENLIQKTDEAITVDTPDGVRVVDTSDNGRWYGIEANQIPNFDAHHDKDGIVYVNEQNIQDITTQQYSQDDQERK